jgi:hypothetical protein
MTKEERNIAAETAIKENKFLSEKFGLDLPLVSAVRRLGTDKGMKKTDMVMWAIKKHNTSKKHRNHSKMYYKDFIAKLSKLQDDCFQELTNPDYFKTAKQT